MVELLMIQNMFKKQNELNSLVDPDWRASKYKWTTAIWTECAEMIEWTNWKWWKKSEINKSQLKIEAVDIFHFGMSKLLEEYDLSECSNMIKRLYSESKNIKTVHPFSKYELIDCIEGIAIVALKYNSFDIIKFIELMNLINMDIKDLYKLYIGKNVLNTFRQDFGYKEGEYNKIWNGKEDNEYMLELVEKIPVEKLDTLLYDELRNEYRWNFEK